MRVANLVRESFARPSALLGACVLLLFALLSAFGPWLVPHDPTEFLTRPHQPPNAEFWFGSTGEGKDVFSQTIVGARITLLVGFTAGMLATVIGAVIGVLGAYFGGLVDEVVNFTINVFLILPGLPLAVVLAAYLPPGPMTLLLVLVVTGWAWNARLLRAQALSLRHRDFVLAAEVTGESGLRIIVFEMLPNLTSLVFSAFISASTYAIAAQVGLEFLGLGDVGIVTWGTNLYWAANSSALLLSSWWTIVPTGVCVALVGFALTLLNGVVDEIANPALRTRGRRTSAILLTEVDRGADVESGSD
jgi:peptide/nickel transport system permease protein